jgi:hypothetical protein
VRRGQEHRRDPHGHAAVILLLGLQLCLGTRHPTGHLVYFFPGTRDTLPPAFFAYVFAADVDLKVFDPFAVVTLGIVTPPENRGVGSSILPLGTTLSTQ